MPASNRYASTACPSCRGEGVIQEPKLESDAVIEVECRACNGSGWVYIQRVCPCGNWRTLCACNKQNKPYQKDRYESDCTHQRA